MKYEPYHALINAIILQAVKDYRTALDDENTSGITECERFFRSERRNHHSAGEKRNNTKKIRNIKINVDN